MGLCVLDGFKNLSLPQPLCKPNNRYTSHSDQAIQLNFSQGLCMHVQYFNICCQMHTSTDTDLCLLRV